MTDSMKRLVICSLTALAMIPAKAQDDSLADAARGRSFFERQAASRVFKVTCVGVPLVAAGLVVKSEDDHFRSLLNDYLPSFNRHADDYLQYLPAAVMVGMKLGGAEGRSSWGRMLASDAFSAVIMGGVVYSLKQSTRVMRPDGSNDNSFPSGHTATAFMTATMLTKEYGHISPWIGIGAYSVATATGLMRMANNKHWLSDVLTGAGIGILSTEAGYYIADLIFNDKGIHYYDIADNCSVDDAPTFVGLYLGLNAMPGNYSLPGNSSLQFSSGSTAGLEGAYFFNPYIGVGGRLAVSNNAVIYKGHALDETLDMFLVHAGAYFSYPIMSRLLIGSKALVGMSFCNQMKTSEYAIGKNCGAGLGTGVSLTFRARSNLGIRMFADYNLSFNRISPAKSTSHLIVIGGSTNVIF